MSIRPASALRTRSPKKCDTGGTGSSRFRKPSITSRRDRSAHTTSGTGPPRTGRRYGSHVGSSTSLPGGATSVAPPSRTPLSKEAAHLELLVLRLVLDPRKTLRRRAIVGELEDAAQQNGDVLERDPGASLDLRNNQIGQVSVRAAEVEMKFHPDHGSPFLGRGTDLELERPRVSGLLVELPVRVRHRVGPHQPAGSEPCEGGVPLALPDPLANPGGVHPGIDDEVRDVDVPRSELPSGALSERPQAELRAGEGRVSDAAAQARGCAGEEDASAPAR